MLTFAAHTVKTESSGLTVNENLSRIISENEIIGGRTYKRFIFPDEYSKGGRWPSTEYSEKVLYFAAPENSSPKLELSLRGIETFKAADLVPFPKFIKGENGIINEVYEIPAGREDRELAHTEIKHFGRNEGMNLYMLVIRPLVFKRGTAELARDIGIRVSFGRNFENGPVNGRKPENIFQAAVINYGYAVSNKIKSAKTTAPCFLDRQTSWLKLKIKDEGIYRITGAYMINSGIDISSVLCSRIKIYSGAGRDIDNNPEVSAIHGAVEISRKVTDVNGNGFFEDNDHIVFYAMQTTQRDTSSASHYFNEYSESTYYWIDPGIGSSTDGRDCSELSISSGSYAEVSTFIRHIFAEKRNTLLNAGDTFRWYNSEIGPLQQYEINFNMKDIDPAYPVKLKVQHAQDISSNLLRIKYTVNGDPSTDSTTYSQNFEKSYNASYFNPGSSNTLTMTNLETGKSKYFNGWDVVYYGPVEAGSSDEYFSAELTPGSGYRFNLAGSSGRTLFDITDPYNVKQSVLSADNCIINTAKPFNTYVLFSGAYKTPVSAERFDNTTEKSLHSRNAQADMVIISPPDFYNFFKNDESGYIKAHTNAGKDVASIEIVSTDEINSEFGRGYQEPAATRNFIRYAYENWGTEYILLAGDGNCYIKNETGIPEKNYIYPADPTNPYNYGQGSDDFYANLYTADPAQHVSLGRFTVSNTTELNNVVSKCVSHITGPATGTKNSKVLLVADDERNPDFFSDNPSSGWYETVHIKNTENYIASIIPRYYYTDKLYSTEYPLEYSAATGLWLKPSALEDLVRKLQSGVNVFCYVGHGAPMQLAHEKLFTPAAFSGINNYENYFFMIGATCSFGVFNDPELKTLSEQMLISANRGSVGLINSVGPVYSGDNERLTGKIFEAAMTDPVNKLTVGKALKYGKTLHPSYSGNSQSYMLIGDPALSFFNDATIVESESAVELYTLVPDSIDSKLNRSLEPSLLDDNGIMNTTIYDSENPRSYFNSIKWDPADDDSLKYVLPGKAVLSVKSTIADGRSTAGFILPKDLTYGDNKGKVLFYGYNGSGGEFTGCIDSVSIRGDAQVTITDSIPPSIRILYNSLNYIAGDPVGSNPVIYTEISDEYGINTSGGIGHKIIMEIDGVRNDVTPNFIYDTDNYKKGHTFYQAVELSTGMHNIKVTAWDNFNNYSEKSETFEVTESEGGSSDRIGNLLNYPNPVKGKGTTFGFAVDSQNDLESYSITVYTINGRKIKVIDDCPVDLSANYQQCFWDGHDADGDEPANGVYIYILRAKFQGAGKAVKRGKLIFAR